ncbi:MAG: T9SS type A sorting domain-containing protein [Bacteroidia bacterium]
MSVTASLQAQCTDWARGGGGLDSDGFPAGVETVNGKVYFTGAFAGSATFDGQSLNSGTYSQGLFLNEYDQNGNLVWAKTIAEGLGFFSFKPVVESGGFLYLLGGAASVKIGQDSLIDRNLFIVKLDTAGNVIWNRIYGPSQTTGYFSAAVPDGNGGLFFCGRTRGTVDFGGTTISTGYSATLIGQIDGSGSMQWVRSSDPTGGANTSRGNDIALSPNGHLIVTGFYTDTLRFGAQYVNDLGFAQTFKIGIWLGAFDQSGNCLWLKNQSTTNYSTTMGGFDCAYGVVADASDNIYVTGAVSDSTDLFGMPLVAQASEPFLAKLDANGNLLWLQRLETVGDPTPYGMGAGTSVSLDANQNPYMTGWVNDTFLLAASTYPLAEWANFFATSFDQSGNPQAVMVLPGGGLYEQSYDADMDVDGNLVVGGSFSSKTLPLFPGSSVTNASTSPTDTINDAVVFKLCNSTIFTSAPKPVLAGIKVFPNPNSGEFFIQVDDLQGGGELIITDMQGRNVHSQSLSGAAGVETIHAAHLSPGLYAWRVLSVGGALIIGQGKFTLSR